MGAICNCDLKLNELPDIEISGMSPDGDWVKQCHCCFVRRYNYDTTPARQVISTDLKRSTWHETYTEIYQERNVGGGCPALFDCKSITGEITINFVERLGLIYELQYVDVYLQKIRITCPGADPIEKILVSTRHYVLYKGAIADTTYSVSSYDVTDVSTSTPDGSIAIDNTPDWDDPDYWAGYWVAPEYGEFWSNKIFDSIPDDNEFNIDSCFEPCESIKFCATNCDGLCVVGSASEGDDFYGTVAVCPESYYVPDTTTFSHRNTFDNTLCFYTRAYYWLFALGSSPPTRLESISGYTGSCSKVAMCFTTTARDLTTECVALEDVELCLQISLPLYFPPIEP